MRDWEGCDRLVDRYSATLRGGTGPGGARGVPTHLTLPLQHYSNMWVVMLEGFFDIFILTEKFFGNMLKFYEKIHKKLFFKYNFYPRPVLAFGYCRCLRLCVSLCVNHLLVHVITRDPFKLGSPNFKHSCCYCRWGNGSKLLLKCDYGLLLASLWHWDCEIRLTFYSSDRCLNSSSVD